MKPNGKVQPGTANPAAILCLSLSMLLASLGTSIANIALPALAQAFDVPFYRVQWVVGAYLAALTLTAILAGRLGDRFGYREALAAGLLLFSLASAICGLATGLWMLIAARMAQGAGAAFLMTLAIPLMRETTTSARTGRMMGFLGTMSAVGTALGPSLGGFLLGASGWRSVFLVLVPAGVLSMVLALRVLPRGEAGRVSPMISFSAIRDAGVARKLLANLLVAAVMMTTLVVGPFYLALALKLPEAMVGLVMSAGPVISILAGVPSGRLVDAWSARSVLTLGLAALMAGALALAAFPPAFGVAGYVAAIAILTPGYQLFQAANNTDMMASVQAQQRGVVSGLLSLSRNLGLIAGSAGMGAVFAVAVGTDAFETASSDAISNGMRLTFLIAGISMVAALWIVRRKGVEPGHAGA